MTSAARVSSGCRAVMPTEVSEAMKAVRAVAMSADEGVVGAPVEEAVAVGRVDEEEVVAGRVVDEGVLLGWLVEDAVVVGAMLVCSV